jgi:predicted nucleotidyltransferase
MFEAPLTAEKLDMMKALKVKIPKDSLENFCRKYQVQSLAVFGSVLRDDFHSTSDIDILVTFMPDAQVSFLSLGRMKRELSEIFHRPVDLVPKEGLKPVIRETVISSSQEIYAI